MNKGIFGVVGILAMLSLAFFGCGGGDDTSGSLTRAEFVKQAEAICKQGEKERLAAIGKALEKLNPNKELSEDGKEKFVLTVALPPYEKQTKQMQEIGLPEEDEEKAEEVVKAMEGAIEKVKADPVSALTTGKPFDEANKAATDFGLKGCVI